MIMDSKHLKKNNEKNMDRNASKGTKKMLNNNKN
jgi:hypothetical protein